MPGRHLVIAFVVAFLLASCLALPAGAEPSPQPEVQTDGSGGQALLDNVRSMMSDMHRITPTGDIDEDFVRLSVAQRQAAIAMVKTELKYGKDERLKALAKEIVTSQEKDIALMKAWEDKRRGGH